VKGMTECLDLVELVDNFIGIAVHLIFEISNGCMEISSLDT